MIFGYTLLLGGGSSKVDKKFFIDNLNNRWHWSTAVRCSV